jgi:hypothetical protein
MDGVAWGSPLLPEQRNWWGGTMTAVRSSPELDENDMEASYFNGKSTGRKRAAR